MPEESSFWLSRMSRTIFFLVVVLSLAGVYAAFQVPTSVFPDTNFPRVVIGVDNGVMPVEQMQVTITKPIEDAVNSVPGLRTVRSTTSRGSAEVSLFFDWNVDMFHTLQLADSALSKVRQTLPATAVITTNRLTFATFPILGYALTADDRGPETISPTRLWEIAIYDLKPPLNRVDGVSTVTVQGGQVPEVHIVPDLARLENSGVTLTDLVNAVQSSNIIDSPGLYQANHELILALVGAQAHDAEHLASLVVKTTAAGAPVRISDVADVHAGTEPVYTAVTANGTPAVLINLARQPSANTVAVANAVATEVAQLSRMLPAGVHLAPFYDQSEMVRESIASVRDAIFIGLVLACIILFLFLRDWSSSLVAGLVVPVTVAVTILFLWMIGQSFNLMTLGGLAAAIGLVIDDAIVVVENIVMHRDAGQSRAEAIRSAIREIRVPLVGSTVTPIVVFLPLAAISGVYGVFFRALAVTVGMALLTSLALALTWTPTLSHYFIRQRSGRSAEEHHSVPPFLMNAYAWVLRVTLEHKFVLAAFSLLLIAGAYLCYNNTGSDLLPAMDEGGFIVDYIMPAGSSLAETNRVITHVEKILRDTPEVENTSRRTGLQLGLAQVTEANTGDISVKLKADRKRTGEQVISDVRAKIREQEPVLDVEFPQLLQDMIGDLTSAPEPVVIKLFSQDPALLEKWATSVGDTIKKLPNVVDELNGIENTISGPATTFNVDQVVTARAGFSPQELELDASAMLQGEPASAPVVVNDRSYTIRVRFPRAVGKTLDSIRQTMLISGTGKTATIGSLASVEEVPGETEIRRDDLQRNVQVTARFEGMNLGDGMKVVQKAIDDMKLPPSIRVQYGGQYAEQQKSFKDLAFVLVLAIVLVFMVLLFEFGDFAAPIAVISSALLSTCGVFLALLITGTTFNLSSFMGLIMVIGIVAKNGILLLDADQKFRAAGMTAEESMLRAGERRLRPIMMTALATVAGMVPLALAWGAGSQMLQPLAIAVIGGILASMVLSLVVTPAVHYYIGGRD